MYIVEYLYEKLFEFRVGLKYLCLKVNVQGRSVHSSLILKHVQTHGDISKRKAKKSSIAEHKLSFLNDILFNGLE